MAPKPKEIKFLRVFYQRNVDLGLSPECYECSSHCRDRDGYPQLTRNGWQWKLHRWLWYQATGEQPEVVMHLCDNTCCIRFDHLRAGTSADNSQDMVRKGRKYIAIDNGQRAQKFSKEETLQIRWLYNAGVSQVRLAKMFKVWRKTIWKLVNYYTYKDVN